MVKMIKLTMILMIVFVLFSLVKGIYNLVFTSHPNTRYQMPATTTIPNLPDKPDVIDTKPVQVGEVVEKVDKLVEGKPMLYIYNTDDISPLPPSSVWQGQVNIPGTELVKVDPYALTGTDKKKNKIFSKNIVAVFDFYIKIEEDGRYVLSSVLEKTDSTLTDAKMITFFNGSPVAKLKSNFDDFGVKTTDLDLQKGFYHIQVHIYSEKGQYSGWSGMFTLKLKGPSDGYPKTISKFYIPEKSEKGGK